MARDHARILTAIWADDEFVALPGSAQRLYMLLLSQDGLTYAGHQDLRVGRWASRAADTTVDTVWADLYLLDERRFLLVDEATEEVLIRSYLRVNEVWKQPKLLTLALRQAASIQSRRLRHGLREELLRLPDDYRADAARTLAGTLPDTPGDTPTRTHAGTPDGSPVDTPPDTRAGTLRAHGGARVTRNLELEPHLSRTTSRGELTEVDAHAGAVDEQPPNVPDTRPAPPEATLDDAPPAPVHANAMPPARCRKHIGLTETPPCRDCADARRAQEAWIADRDVKVAMARAEVAAELAEQRRLERQQIDDCGSCDSRGVTPGGVRCTHDADVDRTSPGRAEWRNARRELAAKHPPAQAAPTGKPANGGQLSKLAIEFGNRGVNDREKRLDLISEVIGRRISTTRELTSTEASLLLDRLEHPVEEPPPPAAEVVHPGRAADQGEQPPVDEEPDGIPAAIPPDDDDAPPEGWTPEDDEPPVYAYAGGSDEPPF